MKSARRVWEHSDHHTPPLLQDHKNAFGLHIGWTVLACQVLLAFWESPALMHKESFIQQTGKMILSPQHNWDSAATTSWHWAMLVLISPDLAEDMRPIC